MNPNASSPAGFRYTVKPYWFRSWGWRWRLASFLAHIAWWLQTGRPIPSGFVGAKEAGDGK